MALVCVFVVRVGRGAPRSWQRIAPFAVHAVRACELEKKWGSDCALGPRPSMIDELPTLTIDDVLRAGHCQLQLSVACVVIHTPFPPHFRALHTVYELSLSPSRNKPGNWQLAAGSRRTSSTPTPLTLTQVSARRMSPSLSLLTLGWLLPLSQDGVRRHAQVPSHSTYL